MRFSFLFLFTSLVNLPQVQSQISAEKIGLVVSTKKAIQSYNNTIDLHQTNKDYLMNRLGGRISFGLNCRLSFDTGLYLDHHNIKLISSGGKELFTRSKSDTGLELRNTSQEINHLTNHTLVNTTIPFNLMFRTFISKSCVTYVRLSYNHSFNIYESEKYADEFVLTDVLNKEITPSMNGESWGFNYFGSDIEFAFGNFWNLDKLNAHLCIEPTITLLSRRTSNHAITDPGLVLYDKHQNAFSAIGFEVMLYKNL